MVLCCSLPETQNVLMTLDIDPEGYQEGFSPTMDGIDKNREGNNIRKRTLLEISDPLNRYLYHMMGNRPRRDPEYASCFHQGLPILSG